MEQRGLDDKFLQPVYGEWGELPFCKEAAAALVGAVKAGKRILIYGDYDADGVTASTVMKDALELVAASAGSASGSVKAAVEVMLPDRFRDGYGMSERLVERATAEKFDLVVTVDCGSNNKEVIDKLVKAGVEVVVTDHHEMLGEAPECLIVNPWRKDVECPEELKNLAGVGVAFMVAYEMMKMGAIPEGQEKWLLDMVVIGTICDSMKMRGANRVLCYWGMKVLAKTRRPGLRELMRRSGVKNVHSDAVGFQLGPRINAAGRMKSAEIAFELLNTRSEMEAAKLAEELEKLNKERKFEQGRAVKEIKERGPSTAEVIVEAGEWHEGVLGIIAGKLVEEFKRPAFVLGRGIDAAAGDGSEVVLKGSGRSFGEFNLAQAVSECQSCLVGGGGHAGACGVKVLESKLPEFRKKVNEYYNSLGLVDQEKYLEPKADLTFEDFSELTVGDVEELGKLEPYGEGNAEPVVLLDGLLVTEVQKMGADEQHVKVWMVDKKGKRLSAVAFFAPEEWLHLRAGRHMKVWVTLGMNEWRGRNVEGRLLKIALAK